MNSLFIAYRSIQERGIASGLTMLSMALGVGLVVAVLSIHGVVATSFRNNSSLGYNMIAGAKGGKEQLVLNTVFYLSAPVENVRYDYYMEFLRKEQRDQEYENSFALTAQRLREETRQLAALTGSQGFDLLGALTLEAAATDLDARRQVELERDGKFGRLCQPLVRDVSLALENPQTLTLDQLGLTLETVRGGLKSEVIITGVEKDSPADRARLSGNDRILQVGDTEVTTREEVIASLQKLGSTSSVRLKVRGYGFAIPLCLGDYLDRFRVVGTTPQLFDDVVYSDDPQLRKYTFSQGRNFVHKSPENGYFEAVLGAQVARELGYKVGDKISPDRKSVV